MNRLIWVHSDLSGWFLLNPAAVILARRVLGGVLRVYTPPSALGGDFIDLNDPDGKLLHLLTDGVPKPPVDVCPRPLPDTGPAAVPGETPSP